LLIIAIIMCLEVFLRKIAVIITMLALCACTHFDEDKEAVTNQVKKDARQVEANVTSKTMRVADNVRDSIKRTGERMREWWITPLPNPQKHAMPVRYCYRVLQDILCYRDQMPGWENKLVAYQGDGAAPPTPATMKLMPLRSDNKNSVPDKRLESLKPVFVSIPPEVREQKSQAAPANPAAIEPAYEAIQDSVLSPQL
jgi:hypothetical protein